MRLLYFIITLLVSYSCALAQSCCVQEGSFAMLALNEDFKNAHMEPLPLNYTPKSGEMISFPTSDGREGQAFHVPAERATDKVLLVFPEWWGLNDYIKREAERWQQLLGDVEVYAVDLYDGQVASDRETASKLSSGLDKQRGESIVKGLLRTIGKDKQVATLGWCMGGTWSFTAARLAGPQAAGCVMYYGVPETDESKIRQSKADVLFIWAAQDKHITRDMVDAFGRKVQASGRKFTMHAFDAAHAFANPSNPVYNEKATAEAEKISLDFLRRKLKLK